ncbi:EamA family transporter [Scytonema sp. UIC 10036]|uniref:DMT family transporter n=1 Tax=Scytonema sp. UIC 10036 TaxID=2304196 RepID=UPI0012DA1C1E|nr:DMT family transporter [Scytonema sp. UIC 10036]MUG97787.1 EamA family transporter [Scytonema sp. UIC 10036]
MIEKVEFSQSQTKPALDLIDLSLLLIAVMILSLAAIFIKLSENELGPNATIFNRLWIGSLALLIWKAMPTERGDRVYAPPNTTSLDYRVQPTWTIRDLALFVVSCGISMLCLLTWAWSITQTSVANSNLLHNLTPIFATLGGWLFLGHLFDGRFLIGLVLTLAGAIAVGVEDLQVTPQHFIGDAVALLSAVFYAGSFLISSQLRSKFSATTILLCNCTVGALLILPIVVIRENQVFPSSATGWLAVIGLGVLCQAIGQGIVTSSLKNFSAGFVSLFLLLEPLMTAIFARILFAERLSIFNWVAFFVIMVGIYLAKSGKGAEQ